MANYVFNYLYADENLIKKYFNEEGKFDFGKVIPIPEISNIERNHWCAENWGTKCNAEEQYYEGGYVEFTTAWSIPDKIVEKIIRDNPKEPLKIIYNEENIGENCGIWQYIPIKGTQEEGEEKVSAVFNPDTLELTETNGELNAIKIKFRNGNLLIHNDYTDNPENNPQKNKKWFLFAGGTEEEWDEIVEED